MDWLAGLYVNVLNLIQFMHDKYYYEAAEMALIDTDVRRTFATGIAGFSHVVDSLSAIKYAKVKTIETKTVLLLITKLRATSLVTVTMMTELTKSLYGFSRLSLTRLRSITHIVIEPTTSILTITSNVVYGKATGTMPDGRKAGAPLSPGANPSYGAEQSGLLASLNSVAKLPYEWALDGISNTRIINPGALGHSRREEEQSCSGYGWLL